MRSQAMTVPFRSASEGDFDWQHVGTEQKEPDFEIDTFTKTGTRKATARYIPFPQKLAHPRETIEKQVGWWFGHVQSVHKDYFTAVLEDLKGRSNIAEFDKEEITPSELSLLVPNARFSFTVTRVDKYSGREYVSKISLSGPPVWTERDTEKAKALYEKLFPEEVFNF